MEQQRRTGTRDLLEPSQWPVEIQFQLDVLLSGKKRKLMSQTYTLYIAPVSLGSRNDII